MEKEKIILLRNKGKTFAEIAKIYGVSRQRIQQIFSGYVNGKKPPDPIERANLLLEGFREEIKNNHENN